MYKFHCKAFFPIFIKIVIFMDSMYDIGKNTKNI